MKQAAFERVLGPHRASHYARAPRRYYNLSRYTYYRNPNYSNIPVFIFALLFLKNLVHWQ
jgi:hypothetical protein